MKKIFLLAAFVLLVSACSTYKPPVEETIQKTITIDRQSSQVFDDVVAFFAEKGTPLKQIDKQSGIVTTESNLKANNDYANCGSGKFRSFGVSMRIAYHGIHSKFIPVLVVQSVNLFRVFIAK